MLSLFRRREAEVDLSEDEVRPEIVTKSLLDRSKSSVAKMLDRLRGDEMGLEREISALTERLRQTRLAITAFDAADEVLKQGQEPKKTEVAGPAAASRKVGRLVPRDAEKAVANG